VILPTGILLPGLNDSKKVPEKRREVLFDAITEIALSWSVAWADEKEVDEFNILNARMLAMERAIQNLKPGADFALIDGNKNIGITIANETVVKGDAKSASIAAASILAKVSRDRYMCEMAQLYPEYAFEKHKGYPTKLHYERLREHGPCPIHRQTFLKKR
jgi:ribonuclease HII